jgi:hypothetical protein
MGPQAAPNPGAHARACGGRWFAHALSALLAATASGGCDKPLATPGADASVDASVSASTSALASPPPRSTKVEIGPGDDRAPERWSSPEESLKAKPAWSRWPFYTPESEKKSYAPQLDERVAGTLFEAFATGSDPAPDSSGEILLVCSIHYSGHCDGGLKGLFNSDRPELDAEIALRPGASLLASGPEDDRSMFVSIPLVSLKPTEKLAIHLFDRDGGSSRDDLGITRLTGRQLTTKAKGDTAIDCRRIPRAIVEEQLTKELATVDQAISELADPKPAPTNEALNVEHLRFLLRQSVQRIAALVGWADPRVTRRLEWIGRVEARKIEVAKELINREADVRARRAHVTHRGSKFMVEVADLQCGPALVKPYAEQIAKISRMDEEAQIGCLLRVHAQNLGQETFSPETTFVFGWGAVVGFSDGQTRKAHMLTVEGPEAKHPDYPAYAALPPGAKGTVVFGVPGDIKLTGDGAPRPRLVIMNPFMGDGPVLLSYDAPADRSFSDAPDGG